LLLRKRFFRGILIDTLLFSFEFLATLLPLSSLFPQKKIAEILQKKCIFKN